jgi:hypothetical protein
VPNCVKITEPRPAAAEEPVYHFAPPTFRTSVFYTGKSGTQFNWQPIIRWVKTQQGLRPDLTILEKYLDVYVKHCAPPRAISLYIWGASSAREHADAYENRRIPTRENVKYSPPLVAVLDAGTGTISKCPVPAIGDEGSEQFWKPMLASAAIRLPRTAR